MIPALEARLSALARAQETTTYGALARDLGLRLSDLTAQLEALMDTDAAAQSPLRAALVCARLTPGLPAKGFFDKARALGFSIPDEAAFAAAQRAALR